MRAGRLRHRVTIQKPTEGDADSYGDTVASWSDVATAVPAEVTTLSGREAYQANQVHPEATVQVKMRYRSDVTTAMRLVHDGRTLSIDGLLPDARKRELACLCHEDL